MIAIGSAVEAHQSLHELRRKLDFAFKSLKDVQDQIAIKFRVQCASTPSKEAENPEKVQKKTLKEDRLVKLRAINRQVRLRIKYTRAKINRLKLMEQERKAAVECLTSSDAIIRYSNALHRRYLALLSARDLITQDLREHQQRVLLQLSKLFPIKYSGTERCALRGFEVPSFVEIARRLEAASPSDFWVFGASLGLTSHLTHLLARYLDIPLPRQIGLFSSKSVVRLPSPTASLVSITMTLAGIRNTKDSEPQNAKQQSNASLPDRAKKPSTKVLQLFDIIQYGVHKHELNSEDSKRQLPASIQSLLAPSQPPQFPFNFMKVSLRWRHSSSELSASLLSVLTPSPDGKWRLESPGGLVWIELPKHADGSTRMRTPVTQQSHAYSSQRPPPIDHQIENLDRQASMGVPDRLMQTPTTAARIASPHISSSSSLPFPQLMGGSFDRLTSNANSSSTFYDPISLALSLFGFGIAEPPQPTPCLIDELEGASAALPLFVKSNALIDRKRFIWGLRDFSNTIRQLSWCYDERYADRETTCPEATFVPNSFRIHDVSTLNTENFDTLSLLHELATILAKQRQSPS